MAASSSKRAVADEIYNKLLLGIEGEIPIIIIKEKNNLVKGSKGSKKKIQKTYLLTFWVISF